MKKICILIIMIITAFLATRCIKSEAVMTVNKNKSMDFTVTYALDNKLVDLAELNNAYNIRNMFGIVVDDHNLTQKGYTVTDYKDDNYTGIKASKHIYNIDAVSSDKETVIVLNDFFNLDFDDSLFFTVKKGLLKNTYTANFIYDLTGNTNYYLDNSIIDASKLSSAGPEIIYEVNLPYKPLSSNAQIKSEDGKQLKWNATYNEVANIKFSFQLANAINIFILIFNAFLIASVVLLSIYKKNINKEGD